MVPTTLFFFKFDFFPPPPSLCILENFKHLKNSTLLFWRVSGGWKEGPGPVSPEGGSCRPSWKGAGGAGLPGRRGAGTSLGVAACPAASRFSVLRGRRGRLRARVRVRARGRGRAVRLPKPRCHSAQEAHPGLPFPPSQVTRGEGLSLGAAAEEPRLQNSSRPRSPPPPLFTTWTPFILPYLFSWNSLFLPPLCETTP